MCLVFVIAACGREPAPFISPRDAGPPPVCEGRASVTTCVGDVAWRCDADEVAAEPNDCGRTGERCVEGLGCRVCGTAEVRCDGETIETCNGEGTGWNRGTTCDASVGLRCSAEGCVDLCARAAEERSYTGCEYWPVVTRNGQLSVEHSFAVAVANPQLVPAVVVIDRGGVEVARATIPPGALELIRLPWVEELRGPAAGSVVVEQGAYHLASDVPVVVTQWNPLEFRIPRDCADEPPESRNDGLCYSFTNDASLLLPVHVLTGNYLVVSRPSFFIGAPGQPYNVSPGFVSIVGAGEGEVEVEVEASARILGTGGERFAPMAPGERQSITLGRGEVLQLVSDGAETCPGVERAETSPRVDFRYCDPGDDYDLTGTIIRADGPVAVVSGHDCAFVPFDRWACDHLEEQLFPVESLGRSALVAPTRSLRREPTLLRIVSAENGNFIRFTPEILEGRTLNQGEHLEVTLRGGVRVEGNGPFIAATFLVGQDYNGFGSAGSQGVGDPAMALAIPDAQYRSSYTFLSPSTFTQSWVDVIAPTGARVVLDRTFVTGWQEIEGTGWSHTSVRVEPGVHRVDGDRPFGLQVYGFAAYTSYFVTGGLDLRTLAPPI